MTVECYPAPYFGSVGDWLFEVLNDNWLSIADELECLMTKNAINSAIFNWQEDPRQYFDVIKDYYYSDPDCSHLNLKLKALQKIHIEHGVTGNDLGFFVDCFVSSFCSCPINYGQMKFEEIHSIWVNIYFPMVNKMLNHSYSSNHITRVIRR